MLGNKGAPLPPKPLGPGNPPPPPGGSSHAAGGGNALAALLARAEGFAKGLLGIAQQAGVQDVDLMDDHEGGYTSLTGGAYWKVSSMFKAKFDAKAAEAIRVAEERTRQGEQRLKFAQMQLDERRRKAEEAKGKK